MSAMKNIHKCGDCLYRDQKTQVCRVMQMEVDAAHEACARYASEENTVTCELCGNCILLTDSILYVEEDRNHITCGQCAEKSGTCSTCICVKECVFQTDPSPVPQVVQKRIQQGPMVQIVQVMNPDRIAITCKMGCKCWDAENETCYKQTCGTCGQYKIVWE